MSRRVWTRSSLEHALKNHRHIQHMFQIASRTAQTAQAGTLRVIKPFGLILAFASFLTGCERESSDRSEPERPNILIILADDLGYSDLEPFGGEIKTPNISALARDGILFTDFYASPSCSPTRAMLLSGVDNHVAGLGNMAEMIALDGDPRRGSPGYEGFLNQNVASISEILRANGYHTYMAGKWHLGFDAEHGPKARGFERSYALLRGGAGHLGNQSLNDPRKATAYLEDGTRATLPANFYSTRFYTEKLIEYIDANVGDDKPFFAYLAYTAPHWPLQAPKSSIARFAGKYDAGYDVIRAQRVKRMRRLGLIDLMHDASARPGSLASWESLSADEKTRQAQFMEVYAAMIADIDRYVGDIISHLKKIGEYDNTVIIFLSDNGPEAGMFETYWPELFSSIAGCCDQSYDTIGSAKSYVWNTPGWAWVSATPFSGAKGQTREGGVRVPAIIHYSRSAAEGFYARRPVSVLDIAPTVLELAKIARPTPEFDGRKVAALSGQSFAHLLAESDVAVKSNNTGRCIGWELMGWRALRCGYWKLLWDPYDGADGWRLFNLKADPNEAFDLSEVRPQELANMLDGWETYAAQNNVVLWKEAPSGTQLPDDAQAWDESAPPRARRQKPR
ncbi:arylsulfatase [Marinicaulis flavus]|uniref:Arylsulfatase n=2 Tax=Hyphococcus luteus TaxID=2058213 RepID=A0A2S7K082_9PROT|nr:arylsulfatase [Marinicaulis flavus]